MAVLYTIGLDADTLPATRTDGDRETLHIFRCTGERMTTISTGPTNRLTALLPGDDDAARQIETPIAPRCLRR
jgi:hypothetical protein